MKIKLHVVFIWNKKISFKKVRGSLSPCHELQQKTKLKLQIFFGLEAVLHEIMFSIMLNIMQIAVCRSLMLVLELLLSWDEHSESHFNRNKERLQKKTVLCGKNSQVGRPRWGHSNLK